ncbi:ribonuclease H-like domain-containing protein [Ferruginibacter sp.]|uniref:ribonuclease H-like domain-containing protein n=1 Tax=Ferruginibacter sp. TaxID=1940288 RepID=UPI0019C1C6AF|nr:ribonuclease H-like domain-containing protein [Ferruginibacter sp.]MBC7627410.1 ribonuclease H-like domain-containing protein [Ferruginibacter sp.]
MIVKMPLENFLVIDIETVSAQQNYNSLNADWQHLWEEKVKRTVPENTTVDEYYPLRAGVMAEFAKVVCISLGYFKKEKSEYQFRVKSIFGNDEKEVLQNFISTINQLEAVNNHWCFTGHNIKEFDIPFLCRRLLINGMSIPSYLDFQNMKPWETNMVDTFQYWRFGDYKNYTSLKLLAASLNVPSPKDDIDGSMVGQVYWEENNLERIAVYCQKDIVTVANIVMRFKNLPLLKEGQIIVAK